jgi:hypothetical protein
MLHLQKLLPKHRQEMLIGLIDFSQTDIQLSADIRRLRRLTPHQLLASL